jgi:alkaline phosphatase
MILLSAGLLLDKKKKFFIMAEQSQIDSANHENNYVKMLASVFELNEGVKALVSLINSGKTDMDWNNTLVIVTADHATGFLRFDKILGRGQLPKKNIIFSKNILKRNESITIKHKAYNELVGCYAPARTRDCFINIPENFIKIKI